MLKFCPFCGGEPKLKDNRLMWGVECSVCGASVLGERAPEPDEDMPDNYWVYYKNTAIAAWNQRGGVVPDGYKIVPRELTEEQLYEILYNINRKFNDSPMDADLAKMVWGYGIYAAPIIK